MTKAVTGRVKLFLHGARRPSVEIATPDNFRHGNCDDGNHLIVLYKTVRGWRQPLVVVVLHRNQ